jgi:hypothetical protein
MKKWNINDINYIEKSPTSPAWLQQRFTDILYNSTNCRCKVESVNPTTGEYRVVLQGTFDCTEFTPTQNY